MEAVRAPPLDARASAARGRLCVFVAAEVSACGTVCCFGVVAAKLPDQAAPAQLLAFRGLVAVVAVVAVVDACGVLLL